MSKILVIDDELGIREALAQNLGDDGHEVLLAENGTQGRQLRAEQTPDLILLDIWMPDLDGLSLLKEWVTEGPLTVPVVMMSGHGTIQHAVEATRLGAVGFLEKPFKLKALLDMVKQALDSVKTTHKTPAHIEGMGDSEPIKELEDRLRRAAAKDAPLFLSHERGASTDAMACARFLHAEGTPWLAPEAMDTLAEAPLQWLEQAKGGLLFLSQIERLNALQQRGLLMLIARRQEYGVRVVCSSAESLANKDGYSRDLYNTLTRAAVKVPALREHPDDIPQIVRRLLAEIAQRYGHAVRQVSDEAMEILVGQDWDDGNIDELATVLEQLALAARGETIETLEVELRLGLRVQSSDGDLDKLFDMPLKEAEKSFKRIYLTALIKRCNGSVSETARLSGMERTHLYRVLKGLGVSFNSGG